MRFIYSKMRYDLSGDAMKLTLKLTELSHYIFWKR